MYMYQLKFATRLRFQGDFFDCAIITCFCQFLRNTLYILLYQILPIWRIQYFSHRGLTCGLAQITETKYWQQWINSTTFTTFSEIIFLNKTFTILSLHHNMLKTGVWDTSNLQFSMNINFRVVFVLPVSFSTSV